MGRFVYSIVAVLVASVVLIASFPIYGSISGTSAEYENEGAGDVRYNLLDSHGTFNISLDMSGDDLTAINGTDAQVFDNNQFFYADNNFSIYLNDDGDIILTGKQTDDTITSYYLNDLPVSVVRTNTGVSVTSGADTYYYGAPDYSYVPLSTGKYATYADGTEITPSSSLKDAYIGSFAGVTSYNNMNDHNLAITLDKIVADDKITGGKWIKQIEDEEEPADIQSLDPQVIDNPFSPSVLEPLDPSIIDDPITPSAGLMAVPTPTYTEGDWGFNASTSNMRASIISYYGPGGNIVIPSTVSDGTNTYTVTTIGLGNNSKDNVVIDNSSIAPNSTLSIPSTVTRISDYAFYNCSNLTGPLDLKNVNYVGKAVFYGTGFSGSLDLSLVTAIYSWAFSTMNNLTGTLTMPNSLGSVPEYCFYNTPLTGNITLPSNLTSIWGYAFTNTHITGKLTIPSSVNSIPGDLQFSNTNITEVEWNGNIPVATSAFKDCSNLVTFNMNNGTTINTWAFSGCTSLKNVTLSPTLTTISQRETFKNCTSLEKIDIPDSVVTLGQTGFDGNGMFNGCTNLKEVNISDNSHIQTIGYRVFSGLTNLKNINLPSTLHVLGGFAFSGSGIEEIDIPDGVELTRPAIFYNCANLKSVRLPNDLTTLGNSSYNGVFENCTSLKEIVLPETLDVINGTCFKGCTSLINVIWLCSPSTIGNNNLFQNSGVKEVLNLGDTELTTTSYGLNAEEVRDNIAVAGFIGNTTYTVGGGSDGVEYTLIGMLPLISTIGLVLGVITLILIRRF